MKQTSNFILEQPLPFNSKRLDTATDGIITEGRVVVTPEMARRILNTCNYDRQRRVSPQHVAKLAVQMKNGAWMQGSQIAFGRLGNADTLVNGQHRLSAVIEYGAPVEFQFLVVPVKDAGALHALYYSFDAVQKSRSVEMILKAAGIVEEMHISALTARGAYFSAVTLANDFRRVVGIHRAAELGTPAGKLEAIRPWWGYVQQYEAIISKATERRLKGKLSDGSVMAVALATLKHQPVKAAAFWSAVAENDGLRKGTPQRTLVDALVARNFPGVSLGFTVCAAICWNAYFSGRQLNAAKVASVKDCRIAGTPWAKGVI